MNARGKISKSLANAFVIGIIVLASLAAMTSFFVIGTGDLGGTSPAGLAPAAMDDQAAEVIGGSRGLNGDGNDYVDLHRDGNGDPQILIDNAAPGVNDIFVGEPNVELDIPVRSIKDENGNDNDGDDILYNVTVSIDTSATTYWDSEACSWASASNYISWDTDTVSPNYKEDSFNTGNALLIDGVVPGSSKYIPWFYNDYGAPGFLDSDNWGDADSYDYYRIWDDYKMFNGFQFDVAGNAPTGVYNISVEITYKYQTYQNVSTQRLSGGGGGSLDPDLGGTNDLGVFDYYFWEPYNTAGGSVDFAVPADIGFRRRVTYAEGNAAPVGATWEAIPDLGLNSDNPNGYNTRGAPWTYHSNYDNDAITSWNDGGAGTLGTVVNNWNNGGINNYVSKTCDQYPYNVNEGNGTWEYSGYEGDTVWSTYKTEIEYVEIRVENGVGFSQPLGDRCELAPDDTFYLKAGDEFKKMYIQVNNVGGGFTMTDVYVNLSLDNNEYFTLKHDWAWKSQINAWGSDNFYYRIDAANQTPVNRYTGNATLLYTRQNVRITEVIPIEFILYFTPNLKNYVEIISPDLQVSKVINKGHPETTVDFQVANSGNTILENGLLTMDFSDFKHSGDEYTDPEGGEGTYSPTLEVPYMGYGSTESPHELSLDVEIPKHWELTPGVFKLLMDYEGYYFNDGVIGEPTNYVKVWMKWYDEDWDPSTDMNSYCIIDTNGDENMDIFGADETRPIEGIYMYVEVEEFVPYLPELKITDVSMNGGTDTFEQGSITNGELELTLENTGDANITDLYVELDLWGYFTGIQYYDGYTPSVENPKDSVSTCNIDETETVALDIEGIDKLLPPGTHRLTLYYQYDYDNGSTPSEISTDNGILYFNITVTDSIPNIKTTVGSNTGVLRLGHKVVDIDLYVNLANKEYYRLSDIDATLVVGGNTPFIPDASYTGGTTNVSCKWNNPAFDYVTSGGQNTNNMYFNLNLKPDAQDGTYDLTLYLTMFNDNTRTTITIPTTLEVKIYPKVANLRITDVQVSTGRVTPGKEFTLDLTIQNDGGEAAREIYVDFEEAYVGGGTFIESSEHINPTGSKYPFSSSVMKAYIAEIQPQSTGQATFTVVGDLNIYPGVTYFQNIAFTYKDSTGGDHQTTDVAPIKSDTSINCKVSGEKYVWDTDREAWIHEDELAAEEVMNYTPFWISVVIIIWLVSLIIAFLFIIKPKYKKDKLGMQKETEKELKAAEKHKDKNESDWVIEEDEEGQEESKDVDYEESDEIPESPYGPPPGPGGPTPQPIPLAPSSQGSTPEPEPVSKPVATAKPAPALPPATKSEETDEGDTTIDEPTDDKEDKPPAAIAKPADDKGEDLPKKEPKKKD